MVTKENLRISGVYGKRIIESISMPLFREDENARQYKLGKTSFFYYPKSRKIYIQGPESEQLYKDILEKVNHYLENLIAISTEEWIQIDLLECLERRISLGSNYHIFNMEVLASLAIKKAQRLAYGEVFSSSYCYMNAPFYEELMLYLICAEDDEMVQKIYNMMTTARSEVDKYNVWDICYEQIERKEKVLIKQNLEKMKI